MPAEKKPTSGAPLGRMIGEYSQIALTLPSGVFAGLGIGYLVDRHFHTGHTFMVIFLVLGFAAGFLELMRAVNRK